MSIAPTLPCLVVLTAPSGAGKTTIARQVLAGIPGIRFSVSATTRPPRAYEVDGRGYHFLTEEQFRTMIAEDDLLEYEEVYPGRFYGTLRAEVDRSIGEYPLLLDVDVKGALSVKERYGDRALTIFVAPPSLEVLEQRLRDRGTETEETLRTRLDRAALEMSFASHFDASVVNDELERATAEALGLAQAFVASCGFETESATLRG